MISQFVCHLSAAEPFLISVSILLRRLQSDLKHLKGRWSWQPAIWSEPDSDSKASFSLVMQNVTISWWSYLITFSGNKVMHCRFFLKSQSRLRVCLSSQICKNMPLELSHCFPTGDAFAFDDRDTSSFTSEMENSNCFTSVIKILLKFNDVIMSRPSIKKLFSLKENR